MKKVLLLCLAVLATLFTVATVSFYVDLKNGALTKDSAAVTVEAGDGTLAVAARLKAEGIIGHEQFFLCYAQGKGWDRLWQQGTFTVEKGMGYDALCALLTAPQLASIRVTVPEGKQVRQIAEIFAEAGVCAAADFLAAAEKTFDYRFLPENNRENPLEGYLFPDTYYFEANSDPEEVIKEMLANFQRRAYLQPYIRRGAELGYSFDEMIILASMVESEAATRADRENVAAVFFNRLESPDYPKLQSCVTVEYALGIKKSIISIADTRYDSPYNTYLYPGLPIGPICCPGIDALEATLYYAENNYYFFQSDEKGNLYFAETYGEHAAVQGKVQENWEGEVIEDYNK